jgi:CSLREA domain-containing protein
MNSEITAMNISRATLVSSSLVRMPKRLTLAMMVILALPQFASPATFAVNSTTDAADANHGDGVCKTSASLCTLRAAIQESNAVPGPPYDHIAVPSGKYVLTSGPLIIGSSVFLKGDDQTTTVIDGDLASRVIEVVGISNVYISDVTIQNGRATSSGGGLFVGSGASVTLTRSTVQNNRASAPGGGIGNGGHLRLAETTVRGNAVPLFGVGSTGGTQHSGGGIVNYQGATMTIVDSAIVNNSATRGGGIRNFGGYMTISNSTISGNSARTRGGGIMNFGLAWIAFSTITNNETAGEEESTTTRSGGGGIYNDPGVGSSGNYAELAISNSIVARNRDKRSNYANDYSPDCFSDSPSSMTSFRGNLVGVTNVNCWMTYWSYGAGWDMRGTHSNPVDPKLGALADNGGPTPTHALLNKSPAIDHEGVTNEIFFDCPETDQRGYFRWVYEGTRGALSKRWVGTGCDAGAFEFGASAYPFPEGEPIP